MQRKRKARITGLPAISHQLERATARVRPLLEPGLRLGFVLGSGFQAATAGMRVTLDLPFAEIPGFPEVSVAGHAGKLLAGELGGLPVAVLSGRVHCYEGYPMESVTFGVRLLAGLGISDLVLTNAAGGINAGFRAGDFMVIQDHINLMGRNPLEGPVLPGLPRFVDLSCAYDAKLSQRLLLAARRAGARTRRGTYLAVPGPSYETPAEIRAFAMLGADAVGMSTVPEVIVARQCGMRVAAISCITNLAAGRSKRPLSHSEVLETGKKVERIAADVLANFASLYAEDFQG